jgi:hypothetical protein
MTRRTRADERLDHLVALVLEIHKITLDPDKRSASGSLMSIHVEEIQHLSRLILTGATGALPERPPSRAAVEGALASETGAPEPARG